MQHACSMYACFALCMPLVPSRSEVEVSTDTSEYGIPAGPFCCRGCRGRLSWYYILCHAARVANASASARVTDAYTRLDLHAPASIWLRLRSCCGTNQETNIRLSWSFHG